MKKLLRLLILFLVLPPLFATTYYINPNGSDQTGDGSQGNPWRSLYYACTQVTNSGDTIHVNAGTYNETQTSHLAPGVNIEGPTASPPTAIIKSWSGANPILYLSSASVTSGNQTVSYIHFDGDRYNAGYLVKVIKRHNIRFHHCKFEEADECGLMVIGQRTGVRTGTLVTGIEIDNNTFLDCSKDQGGGWASGCIHIGYTQGLKIHDNIIKNEVRAGHGIKYWATEGYNKALEIYSNEIHVQENWGGSFVFGIELWDTHDESKIYDNTIEGEINFDIVGYTSPRTYGVAVYNNTFYRDTLPNSNLDRAISFDGNCKGVKIYDNYIHSKHGGIHLYLVSNKAQQHFEIYRNVFYNMGRSGNRDGFFMDILAADNTSVTSYIYIWNNFFDGAGNRVSTGLDFEVDGNCTTMEIINNVITNCQSRWLTWWGNGSLSAVKVKNNDRYNNANNNNYNNSNGVAAILEESGNNTNNPGIVASGNRPDQYYRPSSGSSNLVNAGANVGLPYEGTAPDIGAYEYGGAYPLNASIHASPTSGEVPLTVNFIGSATGGTEPHTYSWDFGDSTSSNEQSPAHTYSAAGDYTVTLTVTDSQSSQDNDSLIINARSPPTLLVASCSASPTSGNAPLTVNFTGNLGLWR
jgi:PKD repeat protein